jgi:hypothetical protein
LPIIIVRRRRKRKGKWEGRIRMDVRHVHGEDGMWKKLTQAKDWLSY